MGAGVRLVRQVGAEMGARDLVLRPAEVETEAGVCLMMRLAGTGAGVSMPNRRSR